jgi:hypothetical protein
METALCLKPKIMNSMETALYLKPKIMNSTETALWLNPKIIDSIEIARSPESQNHRQHGKGALPKTQTIEVVDTVPVRDSNHRQHGKGAFT